MSVTEEHLPFIWEPELRRRQTVIEGPLLQRGPLLLPPSLHLKETCLTFGEIFINEIHFAHHLGTHLDHPGIVDTTDTGMGECDSCGSQQTTACCPAIPRVWLQRH